MILMKQWLFFQEMVFKFPNGNLRAYGGCLDTKWR